MILSVKRVSGKQERQIVGVAASQVKQGRVQTVPQVIVFLLMRKESSKEENYMGEVLARGMKRSRMLMVRLRGKVVDGATGVMVRVSELSAQLMERSGELHEKLELLANCEKVEMV